MKEKKELILKNCRDLIYKEVFNNDYDTVKRLYTDSNIQTKLDDYLDDLISRGESFYGDDFTWDFVNKPTDDDRKMLISDLNSYEEETVYEEEQPKETKQSYEDVIKELVDNCHLSLDQANSFIKKYNKNEEIRKEAINYFENKEKEQELDEIPMAEKDLSGLEGLDVSAPEFENIGTPVQDLIKSGENVNAENSYAIVPIRVKTEEPKPGLIENFKEKWKQPQFRRKVVIGAVIIAVGAVATLLNPEIQSFVGQLLTSFGPDQVDTTAISNTSEQLAVAKTAVAAAQSVDTSVLDTSSWNMEGMQIADNAYDASLGNTELKANQDFTNRLQGFYDTDTNSMLDVSKADLKNADYVNELLQNENVSAVFGEGKIGTLDNVDGFVNGENVQDLINNGRSR